jgi:general secretion pathway protein G
MHPYRARANRGFTLIELLMVVGMIAILAAVALPAYQRYLERARTQTVRHDIVVMSALATAYWSDKDIYPASLADIGASGKVDPWGEPYVYYNVDANGRGGARKDRALNPINSDFDLYSKGPDRVTRSQITNRDRVMSRNLLNA